jgi:luciferase family oxidoreductase group 1
MKLSILDQSPIISGHSAAQAIEETLRLARRADQLGYHRYWLAEHHAIGALADPCPEILLARLGAETRRIRIGTGGVLLPYYSAFRTAEAFRMLEALYPGRVDLGIGRAPGGDQRTAQAVAGGGLPDARQFPEQVWQLCSHLDGTLPDDHPFKRVRVQPEIETAPEVWLLGSSDYSGALAAQLGLRFAFAHFISADGGEAVMREYQRRYRPSQREPSPQTVLCVFVICAGTAEEAERLAASIDLRRLNTDYGVNAPVPNHEEAGAYPYTEADRRRIAHHRHRVVLGTPEMVRDQLLELRERFQADELMAITITGDYGSRLRSYELLAGAFGLGGRG